MKHTHRVTRLTRPIGLADALQAGTLVQYLAAGYTDGTSRVSWTDERGNRREGEVISEYLADIYQLDILGGAA
jgi:hypothetical protein